MLKANPREVVQLKRALAAISKLKNYCSQTDNTALQVLAEQLNPCMLIQERLERELQADPPVLVIKGGVIAEGINEELDRLRKIAFGGKGYLMEMQKREAEATGIPSLKIAFNNVFGYYLHLVLKGHDEYNKLRTDKTEIWFSGQSILWYNKDHEIQEINSLSRLSGLNEIDD